MTATDREAWLESRRSGIGSSDAAAVCGLPAAFGTPLHVFADKVWGVRPEPGAALAESLRLGQVFEPLVAMLYTERTGIPLASVPMARHPERSWQLANIDRVQDGGDGRDVEIKKYGTADGWGAEGTDDVPSQYFVQVQHQMVVRGRDVTDLAALLYGESFRVYEVRLAPDLAARVTQIEADFWGLVERREAPAPDFAHAATCELLSLLHEPDPLKATAATPEQAEWAAAYQSLGKQASDLARQRDALKAQLIHAMGAAAVLSLPDGRIVRRKPVSRKGYAVAPATYVEFRFMKGPSDE